MNVPAETYKATPSSLRYMLRALWPSPGWSSQSGFPNLLLSWAGFRINAHDFDTLRRFAGYEAVGPLEGLYLLAPHVFGFRLLMAMLTHPHWPLPIWRALQVRNRLLLRRNSLLGRPSELATEVSGWRVLEKGIEVDLCSRLHDGEVCAWESVITFYYRGQRSSVMAPGAGTGAAPISPVVDDRSKPDAEWCIEGEKRWRFGTLTGDYNGLHQWNWYARKFGFPSAFAHPQRTTAQCLVRLPSPGALPQQLDLWIKGPVFYGSGAIMRYSKRPEGDGHNFALWLGSEARPALVGRWCTIGGA